MNRAAVGLLVLSLAANGALVVGALQRPVRTAPSPADGAAVSGPGRSDPASATGVAPAAAAGAGSVRFGTGVGSSDPFAVRDALRAAGVPEVYVRAVVWDRIRRSHRSEAEAIVRARGESRYWEPVDRGADAAMREAAADLDRIMREEFRQYFGEAYGEVARARRIREQFAFLSGDKAEAAARISSDYLELSRRIREESYGGLTLEEDQQKLALLEDERRADLAQVLTPGEFELFELHTSRTANTMRSRLAYFEPTEQEFRALFALQDAHDREHGSSFSATSREAMQARMAAQRELSQQIERTLGAERYADYQRATNASYQAAMKIVNHFGLPRENAAAAYALEREYQQRAREAARPGVDRAEAATQAQTMAAEAYARLVHLLGEEGVRAYRDTGGSWLASLEQQARRAADQPRP